jgi:hypothetical protein
MLYSPLTREEVKRVIEGKEQASRVPVLLHFWTYPGAFGSDEKRVQTLLDQYPQDCQVMSSCQPDTYVGTELDPEYRWMNSDDPHADDEGGLDERVVIEDWSQLDSILESFPSGDYPDMFPSNPEPDGRYRLGNWWFCYFERHWSLRGMTNALTDFILYPEETHRFYRALTDLYKQVIERGAKECNWDGFFTSDDIGTQKGPFFSLQIFREFFKPYYKELIDTAHANGMHFWLHTCGNVELFLEDFIEIGLDVIHPIQKYTMDEKHIADTYGSRLCIWAGFDVQQTIPYGTPEDVRKEVRFMMDTYHRAEGRMMLTCGNAITGDTPIPSLEALFDEAFTYGQKVCSR